MTATFTEPKIAIIQKLRSDSNLLLRVPSSSINEAYPVDDIDLPGVYVLSGVSPMEQIVGSANRSSQILIGSALWQISAFSPKSTDEAERIGLIACEALLPSIVSAGLFNLNYTFERVVKNKLFDCYEADYTLTCSLREWRTKELI